jgi:hypothetical protein
MIRRWKRSLAHIRCAECGCGLDYAQPEFVAKHPMPRCWSCRVGTPRQAVYGAPREPLTAAQVAIAPPPRPHRPKWRYLDV